MFSDRGSRMRRRKWKLKHLDRQMDDGASSAGEDYEDFLQDLEEDETIRQVIIVTVTWSGSSIGVYREGRI